MSSSETKTPGWIATALVTTGTATALLGAATAQVVFGLPPCTVCYWQRVPYVMALLLGALALMPAVDNRSRRVVLFHLVGLLAIDAGLAFYHVGVEHLWWAGPSFCSGGGNSGVSLNDLASALTHASHVSCDTPSYFPFFSGLSIAGCNFVFAVTLTAFALFAALRKNWWRQ